MRIFDLSRADSDIQILVNHSEKALLRGICELLSINNTEIQRWAEGVIFSQSSAKENC